MLPEWSSFNKGFNIIRKAETKDLTVINEVYNQAVETKNQTTDITPITTRIRQKWYLDHDVERYPIFVLRNKMKLLVGVL